MSWQVVLTKRAKKDARRIDSAGLKVKVKKLFSVLADNPYEPPYEKLIGDLTGYYSRRINIQHRLVYQIIEEQKVVKIVRMWSHYE
ncbi:MAG: Txe/YoeB family addiction module toxin [Cyanobacteria bacterium P01_D01_bin.1]